MKKRKFIPVESSVIAAIRWTPRVVNDCEKFGVLDVMFVNNPTYFWRYQNVNKDTFQEFLFSNSKGRFYGEYIKGSFDSEKFELDNEKWVEDLPDVRKEREQLEQQIEESMRLRLAERTVADLVKLTKECFIRQINDIECGSVISEIDCDSFPALNDYEKSFINAAFDKIKAEIVDTINID